MILKMGMVASIGYGLGTIIMPLVFVGIIALIQKIRKLKYQRPILHTAIISVIFFILGIMGNLK